MPAIQWGVPHTRTVETGVDRGVLYVEGSDFGVPWSGLKRVERSKPDSEFEPIYFDGVMTNLFRTNSLTSFQIEALSTPTEFMPCLGKVPLASGFYADNQPIKSFGFSYRTLIANAVEGVSYAYKIHMIFQAYASERPIVRQTDGTAPVVSAKSYEVKTIPVVSDTYKPYSYISISSIDLAPQGLDELENILYGTASTNPRLPTITEIINFVS